MVSRKVGPFSSVPLPPAPRLPFGSQAALVPAPSPPPAAGALHYLSFLRRAHSILSRPLLLSSPRNLLSKACHQLWCFLKARRSVYVLRKKRLSQGAVTLA